MVLVDFLAATLAASLLGSELTGKRVVKGSDGVIRAGEGVIRAGEGTNFKTQKYYQDEPRFNGVFSRKNLPRIKDETYVINLNE